MLVFLGAQRNDMTYMEYVGALTFLSLFAGNDMTYMEYVGALTFLSLFAGKAMSLWVNSS